MSRVWVFCLGFQVWVSDLLEVCWYSDMGLCCSSVHQELTFAFIEDPEMCEEAGCSCWSVCLGHCQRPVWLPLCQTFLCAELRHKGRTGCFLAEQCCGIQSGQTWFSFLFRPFVSWHMILFSLIFVRLKGLVIAMRDSKVIAKLRKFEDVMEFGRLISTFSPLTLFSSHGGYSVINTQCYLWKSVALASFSYNAPTWLLWDPFYYTLLKALSSMEREILIIWMAADCWDLPAFPILM